MHYWIKGPLTTYPARLLKSIKTARKARDRMDTQYGYAAHVVVSAYRGIPFASLARVVPSH